MAFQFGFQYGVGAALNKGVRARPVFDEVPTPYAVFALQRVRSAYAGPIVTLRRTSDSVEQSFYAGALGYLSRSAILAWAGTSEIRVKTWHDQMGAHDSTQASAANQHVFDWSGVEPMIYNTSTPFRSALTGALGFGRNLAGLSIAAVGDGTNGSTETMDIASARSGTGNAQASLRAQNGKWGAFLRRVNNGAAGNPVSTVNTDNTGWVSAITEADFAGNTPSITINGVRTIGGNFGGAASSPDEDATEAPTIGASPNGGAPWFGFIRAVAFFQKTFTTEERAAVVAALDYLKPQHLNRYIACWGDSLTQGGYPIYLRSAFGHYRYVHDGGVGGESAASIRARMVADPYYDSRINCLEGGRNGFKTLTPEEIEVDIALMVAHVNGGRYVVGSVTPFDDDTSEDTAKLVALNAMRQTTYGQHYLDMLPIFQAANDGSANDLADVAAGWIPRSLRSDGGHLNAAGQLIKANAYRDKILALGY